MNDEQKHKEDLEAAKGWLAIAKENNNTIAIQILEKFFPELRESEDERIRNFLIKQANSVLESITDDDEEVPAWKSALAWLEKQGEQKPADKVETKFKVGDWITTVNDDGVRVVENVVEFLGNKVRLIDIDGVYTLCPQSWLNHYHLWTIQDAKDGDVLVYPDGTIVLFKYRLDGLNSGIYMSYILLATEIEVSQSCAVSKDIHPATKEQRDLLFQKMKEAGYEWDAEKKELKKIEQSCYHNDGLYYAIDILEKTLGKVEGYQSDDGILEHKCAISVVKKLAEHKSWSEEDEKMCQETIDWFEKKCFPYALGSENPARESIKWLKSIKDRVQPKQEWSEYDKIQLSEAIQMIEANGTWIRSKDAVKKVSNWLKSIKPHWKPSEEQLNMFEHFVRSIGESGYASPYDDNTKLLYSLLNDLKTL